MYIMVQHNAHNDFPSPLDCGTFKIKCDLIWEFIFVSNLKCCLFCPDCCFCQRAFTCVDLQGVSSYLKNIILPLCILLTFCFSQRWEHLSRNSNIPNHPKMIHWRANFRPSSPMRTIFTFMMTSPKLTLWPQQQVEGCVLFQPSGT